MRKPYITLMIMAILAIITTGVHAGPLLDRLLNPMKEDLSNGGFDLHHYKTVTTTNPIGQTFTTAPDTVEISRIAVAVCGWHESWTEDELLVMTLWDSPEKATKVAEAEMKYSWREWEGQVMMFTLNAPVKPGAQYYFELTSKGGDGEIVGIYIGEDYKGGSGYEAGKPVKDSIYFQIHGRRTFDRDAVYSDRFSQLNLGYPGLEKVKAAVQAKDWDKAVDELIAYEEARPELVPPDRERPHKNPDYDPSYADLVMDMKVKDDQGNIIDMGPNWNHYRSWRTRGGVGFTRTGVMKHLAGAYTNTADEKYAKGFNDLIASMIENQPSPLRAGVMPADAMGWDAAPYCGIAGGSMWSALGIGARMNQMWYFYSQVIDSPNFTHDVRAAMIFNMIDQAEVLSRMAGGGNWEAQMSTALYEIAERHPELAKSPQWFEQGITTLYKNLMETCYPDGPIQEPTSNYHCLVVNRFTRTILKCKELGIPIDPRHEKRVEKSLDFIMYATRPDWNMRASGDTWGPVDGTELLTRMMDYYNRSDFRYVGTKGKDGRVPLATSMPFPYGGWYIMRSDWTPDALYLNIYNGKDKGHGHSDALSLDLYAYGSSLVIDPGCYIYGTPEQHKISRTESHSTVQVDGAETAREKGQVTWADMRTFDYFNGTNTGYHGIDGVTHTRKIAFLKPDYWVMSDTVNGTGEHDIVSRMMFLPGSVTLDPATRACHTNMDKGNLLISPLPGNDLAAEVYDYQFPEKGLPAAPALKYSTKAQLPISFGTALVPYKGKNQPKVQAQKLGENSYKVTGDLGTDYICFGSTTSPELGFVGEAAVIRTKNGRIKSLAVVKGSSLTSNGIKLVSSVSTINNLELILDGDILTLTSSSREPSIEVSTLGAKYVRVGCGELKPVTGPTIRPFTD